MSLASAVPSARLRVLGATLPDVPRPVAAYQPAVRVGELVYTSGQLPLREGVLMRTGLLGRDVSADEGALLARVCTMNALAAVGAVADLDAIERIVKVVGFVASADGFTDQPAVIDGASTLLREVFGAAGEHARSAVGVAALPLGAPVEVELIVKLRG